LFLLALKYLFPCTREKKGSRKEFERANLTTVGKGLGKKLIFSVVTNIQNKAPLPRECWVFFGPYCASPQPTVSALKVFVGGAAC